MYTVLDAVLEYVLCRPMMSDWPNRCGCEIGGAVVYSRPVVAKFAVLKPTLLDASNVA